MIGKNQEALVDFNKLYEEARNKYGGTFANSFRPPQNSTWRTIQRQIKRLKNAMIEEANKTT